MFEMCFAVMSDVRSNDILELFGCYVEIFVFNDVIQFFKKIAFCFLDEIDDRLLSIHLEVINFTPSYCE
jgi:hypothetical protein